MQTIETFGAIIKMYREQRKLPLRVVAKEVGIDTSTLGKIEKNERKPSRELITKFSNYFNASEKELIIASISDTVAYKLIEADFASEILKVAEQKVKYIKNNQKSSL